MAGHIHRKNPWFLVWIESCIHIELWYEITHPCTNFQATVAKVDRKMSQSSKMYTRNTADCRLAPSQWAMLLQSNDISHWLGPNLESALRNEIYQNLVQWLLPCKWIIHTLRWKALQGDIPGIHWRRWRQASMSPLNTKAVTLMTFPFFCTCHP